MLYIVKGWLDMRWCRKWARANNRELSVRVSIRGWDWCVSWQEGRYHVSEVPFYTTPPQPTRWHAWSALRRELERPRP